jgi:hypothetical protein
MSQKTGFPEWGVLSVIGTPVSATTGAASAVLALPLTADGNRARMVWVQTEAGSCYVRPAQAAGTVAAGAGIIVGTAPFILNVRGFTHLAHIQITGAQTLVVVPLEV